MIHTRTRSNAAGYVTLGLQTFEYTYNRSARETVKASKVSRCRQLGSRRQPFFEDRLAQFIVKPARPSLMLRTGAEREFIRANGLCQASPFGPKTFSKMALPIVPMCLLVSLQCRRANCK